ncbi:MAG TPA: hypothetical protein VFY93_00945 [Planctomycetota bacterium]|nr:hypothetical protein [Planctomycetota bacterium]
MRQTIACLSLVAFLIAGCGGGGVEGDLKKSGDTLRKDAEGMSVSDLEAKMKEIEEYSKKMQKEMGDGEPTQAQMEKMTKLMEVTGIYATALMQKKMK